MASAIDEVLAVIESHWDEAVPQIDDSSESSRQVNKLTKIIADRARCEIPTPHIDGRSIIYEVGGRKLVLHVFHDQVEYQKILHNPNTESNEVVSGSASIRDVALANLVRWVATGRKHWHSEG